MVYRPMLTVRVEALGGVFHFTPLNAAVLKRVGSLMALGSDFDTDKLVGQIAAGTFPADVLEAFEGIAVDGIRAWEDVLGEDGQPLPCTPENRAALPLLDKVLLAAAYLSTMEEIAKKGGPAAGLPTSASPPADSMSVEDGAG